MPSLRATLTRVNSKSPNSASRASTVGASRSSSSSSRTLSSAPSTLGQSKPTLAARRCKDQAHCSAGRDRCTPSSADSRPYSTALSASQFRTTSSEPLTTVWPKTWGWRRTSFSRTASATSPTVKSPASAAMSDCIKTCSKTSPSSSRSLGIDSSSIASRTS